MATKRTAIGIDLGTTYSRVAVWQNGKIEVLANEYGNRMTPSCVAFTDSERFIGDQESGTFLRQNLFVNHCQLSQEQHNTQFRMLISQESMNPNNTFIATKRLIGCKLKDPKVQKAKENWQFAIFNEGTSDRPVYKVDFDEGIHFAPAEISAMMLTKMKEIAETHLDSTVEDAVITVPSCFNYSQRQATLDAATIAGLNVLRLINESTAAALTYEVDKKFFDVEIEKNVLVFSMGGGTTSVSVLRIENSSSIEVKATAGDSHLGGEDFDYRLVAHLLDEFKRKYKKYLSSKSRAMIRLKAACEKAKRTLSSSPAAIVAIEDLYDEIDFKTMISRARFEELCIDLFRSALQHVESALRDAKLDKGAIHDVVLVGGSTRIPKIQELLGDFFNGKQLNKTLVDLDEAAVYGAAVQAAILSGSTEAAVPKIDVVDVIPFALGYRTGDGVISTVIEKHAKIPFKSAPSIISTAVDDQLAMTFPFVEFDPVSSTKGNKMVGSFKVSGIHPAPKGVPQIEIKIEINANGMLHFYKRDCLAVGAVETEVTSSNIKSRLSVEEIERMTSYAKEYQAEDDKQRKKIEVRNQLESYITGFKQAAEEASVKAAAKYEEVINFLDDNQLDDCDYQDFEKKLKDIQKEVQPLIMKLHGAAIPEAAYLKAEEKAKSDRIPRVGKCEAEVPTKKDRRN